MSIKALSAPSLLASLSLAGLAALGCSGGWEPGAPLDDAPESAALESDAASSSHEKKCRRHVGVHAEWKAAAPLPVARARHSALLLPDGNVLVAGGLGNASNPTSVESYNPATN